MRKVIVLSLMMLTTTLCFSWTKVAQLGSYCSYMYWDNSCSCVKPNQNACAIVIATCTRWSPAPLTPYMQAQNASFQATTEQQSGESLGMSISNMMASVINAFQYSYGGYTSNASVTTKHGYTWAVYLNVSAGGTAGVSATTSVVRDMYWIFPY